MERWIGKVAVVTGASSGIGEATVRDLVASGIKVVALARRIDRLQAMEAELSGKGEMKGIQCDITKEEEIVNAFKWIEENWGGVHIMVNNAGMFYGSNFAETDAEKFKQMFDTNIVGLVICTREALKSMKEHGIDDGHIVNINSIVGHNIMPYELLGGYAATKHGVTVLNECLRCELGANDHSIKVTSISPGVVESEMSAALLRAYPSRPYLTSSAISQAILYVLSTPPNVNISEMTIQPVKETYLQPGSRRPE